MITVYSAKKIITMNPARPFASHLAVKDGRILGTGNLDELEKGGDYRLRATGRDRFNQPVIASTNFTISDQSDQVKLRIFAETTQIKLGQSETIGIHSRLEHRNDNPSLALITFEGDRIISYQVMELKHGENPITIQARQEHFPNFFGS